MLELYLNRIYLSAGVYGVETMSRHLFGRPAKQLNLAECALIAGLARAPSDAVALVEPRRRDRAQPRRAHQDARGRVHHRVAGARSAADEHSHPAVSRRQRSARRLCEGIPAPAVPRAIRRRPSARLGGPDDVRARAAGYRGAGRAQRACRGSTIRQLQAALVAIDPRTGNILALVGGRDFAQSQFNRATPQPASAGIGVQAAALCRGTRARLLAGVRSSTGSTTIDAAGTRRMGAEERGRRHAGCADAPGGAPRVEQSGGNGAAAARGVAADLRLASHVGLDDMPDVPSLSLGTGLVTPLESDRGVRDVSKRRACRRTARDRSRASMQTEAWRSINAVQSERVMSPQIGVSDGVDAVGRASIAARARRLGGRRHVSRRREDGHDERFQGCLVRRASRPIWWSASGSASTSRRSIGREAYGSRYAAPIWTEFMRRAARTASARRVRCARRPEGSAALPRLVPASRRRVPDLHRIPEARRQSAGRLVHDPPRQHQAAGSPRARGGVVGAGEAHSGNLPVGTRIVTRGTDRAN